eukprot:TRINITY_DN21013_c0_g1_i1.p1 TRINITY_DN21013_c0_g1~~TRINITY_DN21013_c0_g1_i1.p1  ORF type:complete len:847 (-),score=132.91 TRINITY_DN21013_c0_g1_i1:1176-3716(-)
MAPVPEEHPIDSTPLLSSCDRFSDDSKAGHEARGAPSDNTISENGNGIEHGNEKGMGYENGSGLKGKRSSSEPDPREECEGSVKRELRASVGPKVESLDYEVVESLVYQEDWRSRTKLEQYQYVCLKWLFVLLVGIGTGLASFGINMAVENIAGLKFIVVTWFLDQQLPWAGCAVYAACNMLLVGAAALLCILVAPAAAGSGIPEVKAYLNGVDLPNILSPKTLLVKILGSIGSVGGGLVVGKEGPLVHTGACIAAFLGQGGSKTYGLDCKWLRFFKNDRDRRDLVTCGAAAGVAAAFRAPVGGVLFALEEVTSWWRSALLWRAFFTNAVVAVVLRTVMSWCSDKGCGLFSDGGFIIFDEFEAKVNYGLLELAPVIVLGVTGGILGSLFNHLNLLVCTLRRDRMAKSAAWVKVLDAVVVALITSLVQFSIPWTAKCTPCPVTEASSHIICPQRGRIGNFKSFNCPDGHYNDLASLNFNTNDDIIRNLFSSGTENEFSYLSLSLTLVTIYSLALITYGISVPSGLFVPAILCGATYGRLVGRFMVDIIGINRVNEGTYALLGSASFLGGSMRMTVSICVILLELTGNLTMLPLIMLTLLIAKTCGDFINVAIYDTHLRFKNVPILDARPPQFMKRLTALDALRNQKEVISFEGIEKVSKIVHVLQTTQHHAFPVVNDPAKRPPVPEEDEWCSGGGSTSKPGLFGIILRSHLLALLRSKENFLYTNHPVPDSNRRLSVASSLAQFGKASSGKGLQICDIQISEEEAEMYLDLETHANPSPYIVSEEMNLAKVYTLFRQLGLRHLCVVPNAPSVTGIITRKDLLQESYDSRLVNTSSQGLLGMGKYGSL